MPAQVTFPGSGEPVAPWLEGLLLCTEPPPGLGRAERAEPDREMVLSGLFFGLGILRRAGVSPLHSRGQRVVG